MCEDGCHCCCCCCGCGFLDGSLVGWHWQGGHGVLRQQKQKRRLQIHHYHLQDAIAIAADVACEEVRLSKGCLSGRCRWSFPGICFLAGCQLALLHALQGVGNRNSFSSRFSYAVTEGFAVDWVDESTARSTFWCPLSLCIHHDKIRTNNFLHQLFRHEGS